MDDPESRARIEEMKRKMVDAYKKREEWKRKHGPLKLAIWLGLLGIGIVWLIYLLA